MMSMAQVAATVADVVSLVPGIDAFAASRDTPEVSKLIAAAQAGDADAFSALVAIHQGAALRTAAAALGRSDEAEDVAQDAFVLAWRHLARFRGDSSFRTWLFTIVWRQAVDRRRRQRRWWHLTARTGVQQPIEIEHMPAIAGIDPERAAVAGDLVTKAQAAILTLTPTLRDTLLLSASGDHSYAEIAGLLGVPIGTVKWRVVEARRLLRKALDHD